MVVMVRWAVLVAAGGMVGAVVLAGLVNKVCLKREAKEAKPLLLLGLSAVDIATDVFFTIQVRKPGTTTRHATLHHATRAAASPSLTLPSPAVAGLGAELGVPLRLLGRAGGRGGLQCHLCGACAHTHAYTDKQTRTNSLDTPSYSGPFSQEAVRSAGVQRLVPG